MNDGASRPRVYLDTNVFIRALEGEPEEAQPLRTLFEALRETPKLSATSELTLAELLAPSKAKGPPSTQLKRLYLNLIVWGGYVDLRPITRSVLYETADLRRAAPHKLPDAIHIVTAVQAGCVFFMSNDGDANRLPKPLTRLKPDYQGVKTFLDALHA